MMESLTEEQAELANAMEYVSQDLYCAGWMHRLEHTLWGMMRHGNSRSYGLGEVSEADLVEMGEISKRLGGWITWSHEMVPSETVGFPPGRMTEKALVFVTFDEWAKIYRGP